MSQLDDEIEATRKLSQQIAEQSERLAREALDESKQLGPAFATFDKEMERLIALKKEGAGPEHSLACLSVVAEVMSDWAAMEVAMIDETAAGKPAPAAGGRAAPRRGLRA